MFNPYDKPLRFKLDAIRSYQVWHVMLYMTAVLLSVFFTALPIVLKITLTLIFLLTLYWQWQKLVLLPRLLIRQDETDWVLEDQKGNITTVSLSPDAYVAAWLIILSFKLPDGKRRPVIILPYMLDKNSFRQLSAYLRMTNLSTLTDE